MMFFLIYKKQDGQPLLQESLSSFYTKETYDPSHNFEHVVNNHGGIKEDYDILWLEKVDPKVYTHYFIIQNGEVVFSEEKPKPPEELSEIEKLRIENAQANAELFEMILMLTGGAV